ncbi:hypothetical protein BuS5_00531 [Desulfosarcina sp. BuS5]|uniref:DnaJ family domain-containing protein n=1 Tax=Desulfosarcina sp. BuS5 TaxID=933262 RepID=UPI0004829E1A|nr:DUF1992 domain-containing protein [Desulfosarcina sp. BuS5]WDN87563.1 hypothetical protein BuS5_00531 [Desulfosarcina sp. BuS5]
MITGFEKIVEERIRKAQKKGLFKNLPGSGKPISESKKEPSIPNDLHLAYKILKNADCLPPEIELKKKIQQTEDLLAGIEDAAEKYRTLKKLNYLIMKLNVTFNRSVTTEVPQQYATGIMERFGD